MACLAIKHLVADFRPPTTRGVGTRLARPLRSAGPAGLAKKKIVKISKFGQIPREMHRWVPWAGGHWLPARNAERKRTNRKQRTTNIAGGLNDES
jgi:hypothetical protein